MIFGGIIWETHSGSFTLAIFIGKVQNYEMDYIPTPYHASKVRADHFDAARD